GELSRARIHAAVTGAYLVYACGTIAWLVSGGARPGSASLIVFGGLGVLGLMLPKAIDAIIDALDARALLPRAAGPRGRARAVVPIRVPPPRTARPEEQREGLLALWVLGVPRTGRELEARDLARIDRVAQRASLPLDYARVLAEQRKTLMSAKAELEMRVA